MPAAGCGDPRTVGGLTPVPGQLSVQTYGPPCSQVGFLIPVQFASTYSVSRHAVAKMDIRTSGASIINAASMSHLHCRAFRMPINCQAIYIPSRKHHRLQVGAANSVMPALRHRFARTVAPYAKPPMRYGQACLPRPLSRHCDGRHVTAKPEAIAR